MFNIFSMLMSTIYAVCFQQAIAAGETIQSEKVLQGHCSNNSPNKVRVIGGFGIHMVSYIW